MTHVHRILHLIPTLSMGGAELFVERLARAQRGSGFEASVCAMHRGGPVEARLAAAGIPLDLLGVERASVRVPWRAARDARALLRGVRAVVRARGIELIQTHLSDADWVGLLAARKERIPCVMTFHNPTLLPQGRGPRDLRARLRRAIQARIHPRADALIAVSEEVRRALCQTSGIDAARVDVIPSGIDARPIASAVERERSRERHAALLAAGAPILISVGRLVESKGHDRVLAALPSLVAEHPRLCVWIVGDGPEREALAARARELQVDRHVRWLGSRDDVAELLDLADVFVTGTRFEGLGLAVAEAMQSGRPVVAFRVRGVDEVVLDGATGVLVDDGDVAAFSRAISALLSDPARRARLGAAGIERSRRYEIEHARAATDQIYRRLLG